MEPDNSRPAWMDDTLVQTIPQKKLDFLSTLFTEAQGRDKKDLMAFLMPVMKKAKQENLTFTPAEMNAAITAIRNHSSREEKEKIDNILKRTGQHDAP